METVFWVSVVSSLELSEASYCASTGKSLVSLEGFCSVLRSYIFPLTEDSFVLT